MTLKARKLADSFAVMKPDQRVAPVEVSPSLYEDLDRDFDLFKGHSLVAEYTFTQDWPNWERHPAGDEIVMLLSGQVEMRLRTEAGEESVLLQESGEYVIVPAGIWHTAKTSTPSRMLFITPGEGTEHRENP